MSWNGEERRKVKRDGRAADPIRCQLHHEYLEERFDHIEKNHGDKFDDIEHRITSFAGQASLDRHRLEETIKEDIIPLRQKIFNGLSGLPGKLEQMEKDQRRRGLAIFLSFIALIGAIVAGVFFLGNMLGKLESAVASNKELMEAHDNWGRRQQHENENRFDELEIGL